MASPQDNVSMALFCDFENVALGVRDANYEQFDIKPILERLLLKGSIVIKKAYCDWDRYKTFKKPMHEANFELIEIPHVRQSGKNSADIRLVVDALDLCYTKSHVNTFVIISGDSDFSPLVSKLRENNKQVIGVGVKQSTSDLLVANCDEFIFYDDLVRENQRRAAKRSTGTREAQPVNTRSPEEEKRRKDDVASRRSKAIELAVETFDALVLERGDGGKMWASVLKEAIKRRKPDFNESYYGFRAFGNLLEEAQSRGLLEFGRDEKSGTYVYRGNAGLADGESAYRAGSQDGESAMEAAAAAVNGRREPREPREARKRGGRKTSARLRDDSAPAEGVRDAQADLPLSGAAGRDDGSFDPAYEDEAGAFDAGEDHQAAGAGEDLGMRGADQAPAAHDAGEDREVPAESGARDAAEDRETRGAGAERGARDAGEDRNARGGRSRNARRGGADRNPRGAKESLEDRVARGRPDADKAREARNAEAQGDARADTQADVPAAGKPDDAHNGNDAYEAPEVDAGPRETDKAASDRGTADIASDKDTVWPDARDESPLPPWDELPVKSVAEKPLDPFGDSLLEPRKPNRGGRDSGRDSGRHSGRDSGRDAGRRSGRDAPRGASNQAPRADVNRASTIASPFVSAAEMARQSTAAPAAEPARESTSAPAADAGKETPVKRVRETGRNRARGDKSNDASPVTEAPNAESAAAPATAPSAATSPKPSAIGNAFLLPPGAQPPAVSKAVVTRAPRRRTGRAAEAEATNEATSTPVTPAAPAEAATPAKAPAAAKPAETIKAKRTKAAAAAPADSAKPAATKAAPRSRRKTPTPDAG